MTTQTETEELTYEDGEEHAVHLRRILADTELEGRDDQEKLDYLHGYMEHLESEMEICFDLWALAHEVMEDIAEEKAVNRTKSLLEKIELLLAANGAEEILKRYVSK